MKVHDFETMRYDGYNLLLLRNLVTSDEEGNPEQILSTLLGHIDWIRRENTPRMEYFCSDIGKPYTYGRGAGIRTYHPQPWTPFLRYFQAASETLCNCKHEVLFMNRYDEDHDQLGWHADDSPEMDDNRPISIISYGSVREIYFRRKEDELLNVIPNKDVFRVKLPSNSMLIMPKGFQVTHEHKIPKSGVQNAGPRISLTFRGYVDSK